jgi:tetratricopeptide (TPR) repeat protein
MNEKDLDLIRKFLDNELNEEEAALFKSKYEGDAEFKKEANLRSGIYISLDAASRASLKVLSKDPSKRRSSRPAAGNSVPVTRMLSGYLKYAAILVALLAVGIIIILNLKQKPAAEELYASFFQPPDENTIPKPRGGMDLADFSFIIKEIDQGNYSAKDTLQSPDEFFYFGIYCMNHERFTEAIYAFSELVKSRDKYFKDGSEWYLGLCYLRTGRMEDAIRAFSEIASTRGHEYQAESRELLSKLR